MGDTANDQRDIETDVIRKPRGVFLQVAGHRLTLPVGTIVLAILGSLGTAYRVVAADRDAVIARLDALEKADVAQCQRQEMQQIVLVDIRTKLARIDARVAEVQVTLMRGAR